MRRALLACLALGACPSGEPEPEPYQPAWPTLACDDIAPSYCGFPFPNNVFTRPDPDTGTGLRVALDPELVPVGDNATAELGPWLLADGFAPTGPLLVHMPGASAAGLAPSTDIGASLDDDALTVILDVRTGERVPHWVELDVSSGDERTVMLHPAVRLRDATRYAVAVRGVSDVFGAPLPTSSPMSRLIAGDGPEERQDHYEHLFSVLAEAGWTRGEVQVAWDFTTASRGSLFDDLVFMRDHALELVGEGGPAYTLASVEDDWNTEHIAYRIKGTFTAPLFLTGAEAGATLLRDGDGRPVVNPEQPTTEVPFEVLIPNSALTQPKPLLQYGHGLFGRHTQIESGHFRSFIDEYGWVFFAADLDGMNEDDAAAVTELLLRGDTTGLVTMFDRLHQGFVQWVLLMELMQTGFAADPQFGAYLDPSVAEYHGISQGGIMGVVYAGLSPHVRHAALGVMGQPYSLLLPRSVDFTPFFLALQIHFDDSRDIALLLALSEQLWARVEPAGWSGAIAEPVAGAPPKRLLMRAAVGDHQVPTLGAHILARTVGAAHVHTGVRSIWGLDAVDGATDRHAYVEYDFGLPTVPACNVPMDLCDDPHGKLRGLEPARLQLDGFLRTGAVTNHCDGGICAFPELSGCSDGEDEAAAQALCGD